MTPEYYNVVFYGEIAEGHNLEEVKSNLAKMFKLNATQVEQFFIRTPVAVKTNVDHQTGLKYKAALEKAGMVCKIVATEEPSQENVPPFPETKTMTCPKCGFEQEESPRCTKCGIFVKNYLKMKEREAQKREYEDEQEYETEEFIDESPKSSFFQTLLGYGARILVIGMIAGIIGYCTTREQVVTSKNKDFQLTKPRGWSVESDLNEDADIQIANTAKEGYFIVISELKIDFDRSVDYKSHSALTRSFIREETINYEEVSGPTPVNINRMKGVQYEITGSVEGIRIKLLHTTLEGKKYFHQMVAWSLTSKYDENRDTFDKILNSFDEL